MDGCAWKRADSFARTLAFLHDTAALQRASLSDEAQDLTWISSRRTRLAFSAVATALGLICSAADGQDVRLHYLDQGRDWTATARRRFYAESQGSELIPLAWLKALKQANGAPFLDGSLARYGYIVDSEVATGALPIGFAVADADQGPVVGLTCAACHDRQIDVDGKAYRIDGAPAFADFGAFAGDLDLAVHRVLDDTEAFETFADAVLGAAPDGLPRAILHAEVRYWWTRFHALVGRTLPEGHPWGPARLDETAMIDNTVAGLDLGPAPMFLLPENLATGDAPVRYPFLWNAAKQDFTGWTGNAANGNAMLALARNLGKLYGTFANFRPMATQGSVTVLDRNYLTVNSADLAGLAELERLIGRIGPPAWPWPVDAALAQRGKAVFERATAEGGCVQCHGVRRGLSRPPVEATWATPSEDVGTDARAWTRLQRQVQTGTMEGAAIPGIVAPLAARERAFDLVGVAVLGTIIDHMAAADLANPLRVLFGSLGMKDASPEAPKSGQAVRYEARVLQGVWAAAPYLHNGSVMSLADLLKPAAQRTRIFKVGPAYDPATVGLALDQPRSGFTMHATGCEDRGSGDSDCGHEFGTSLPDADKKALLEYMKAL